MKDKKSRMRQRRQNRRPAAREAFTTQDNELPIAVQQAVYAEKNSLLFTQILSDLVWNG